MSEQVFSKNFFQGIADYQKQIPMYNLTGDAQAALIGNVAWMRAVDYRTDPMAVTIMPAALKESGSVITDLLKWADTTPEALTLYAYGNTGWIYSRTSAGSWTQLHQVPSSHGNGLSYFFGDDYVYYTSDSSLGRYGPIASSPQFDDNFLKSQGGIPTNTASILLASSSSMYGHAADSASLEITGNLTLETFFKANTLPAVGNSMTLVGKWDESGATRGYKLDLFGVSGYFGNGGDGSLTISSNTTEAPIDSACTGTSGTQTLSATNASFAVGQVILIHQSQGTNAGQWERNTIQGYTAGTITLGTPLIGSYVTGAQVRVLKQYTNVTINSSVTYTTKAWNGTVGGILAFLANGTVTINGTITANGNNASGTSAGSGIGFSGNNSPAGEPGTQGVGTGGIGSGSANPNGNAGGGGYGNSGAGGGGNGTSGGIGTTVSSDTGNTTPGSGGNTTGSADLTSMVFGGSGGSTWQSAGAAGGAGGAIIFITGTTFTMGGSGAISANGGNGGNGTSRGGGGGGAGGSILLKAQTATLGTNQITATGGNGGTGGSGGNGGNGGNGRIALSYYTSYTGTTNPTLNATQDNTLVTTTTIQARLGISDDGTHFEYLTMNLTNLTTGVWNRLSVAWTASTSTAVFYMNAVNIGMSVGTKTAISSNTALLTVGANNSGSGIGNYFDGLLNDMRIWSNVQSASQIAANNLAQINASSAGLAAYYKFNSAATDATGNANNLTLVNTPTYSSDVPFPAPTTRLDIDTQNTNTGQVYTLPTSISEASADSLTFTPVNDPQASMGFFVDTVGTGDWTVTIHDQQNKVIATQTIAHASVPSGGEIEFIFSTPWRIVIGKTYHAHLTVSTGTSKVVTGTASNFSTAEYATYFAFLVTDTAYHPIQKMLNLEIIANERYLATWDGAFYDPNAIAFPAQTHVRCFGFWREYIAIGTWKEKTSGTASITDWNEGRIYFWDGISQTFNFYIDVPEGQVNALFGVDYSLYMFAGWIGQLLVYQGGYIETVSTQANKVKKIPLQARSDQVEIYPSAINMYRSMLHFGVAGPTSSSTIQKGVYSWGTINQLYPETLSYDYVISTGNNGSTVSIGLVYPQGSQLLIGWQDGSAYGVDVVDFTNNPPASSATIEFLIQDNADQRGNGIWKQKRVKQMKGSYAALTSGQSIALKTKIDRASSWSSQTDSSIGSKEKVFSVNPGLGREWQVAVDLFTTTSTSPTLYGVSVQYDDQLESKQF